MKNRINLNCLYSPDNNITKYKTGETIISKGVKPDGIYIIKKGLVKIQRELCGDGNFTTEICGVNDILGLSELMNNEIYNINATCITNCELYYVTRKQFNKNISITPELYIDLMRYLCNRIDNLEKDILVQSGFDLSERILRLILILSNKFSASEGRVSGLRIYKSDLAQLLKTPEKNIEKEISKLISENIIIDSDKGISIKNLGRLKAVCNEF